MSHRSRTDKAAIAQPTQRQPFVRPPAANTTKLTRPYSTITGPPPDATQQISKHVPKSRIPRPSGMVASAAAVTHPVPQLFASSRSTVTTELVSVARPNISRTTGNKMDQGLSARTMHSSQNGHNLRRKESGLVHRPMPTSKPEIDSKPDLSAALPSQSESAATSNLPPRLVPELQALAASIRRPILTPSSISTISSPSTHFSDSPGPWSVSTAATASTSWSSASPSMLHIRRSPAVNKRSQTVPIPSIPQPSVSKHSSLKETEFNTNLWPTMDSDREVSTPSRKSKKSTTPAPTPPPRSSSVKRSRSRSSSKSEAHPSNVADSSAPPLPTAIASRELERHESNMANASQTHRPQEITNYHQNLQNALYSARKAPHVNSAEHAEQRDGRPLDEPGLGTEQRRLMGPAQIGSKLTPSESASSTQSSRSRLAKFSKLALFSRSTKSLNTEAESKPQVRKLQRKGPAAGTGHEGYARYRKGTKAATSDAGGGGTDSEGSIQSSIARPSRRPVRDESTRNNRSSQSDLDDFAASRMRPVTIVGGSGRNASSPELVRFGSGTDNAIGKPSIAQPLVLLEASQTSQNLPTAPFMVESPTELPDHQSIITQQAHPEGQILLNHSPRPTSASQITSPQPFTQSWNTSQSSFAPSYVTSVDGGSDMFRVNPASLEQKRKKIRRSKWNIFRRKDTDTGSTITTLERTKTKIADELPVSVSDIPAPRALPYYAVMESETDTSSVDAIGLLLNEAAQYAEADDEDDFGRLSLDTEFSPKERVESILLPSAPQFRRDLSRSRTLRNQHSPYSPIQKDTLVPQPIQVDQQQSRLPQVGRIPKVVTATQVRHLNRKSFSRPFTRSDQQIVEPLPNNIPTVSPSQVSPADFTYQPAGQQLGPQDLIPLPLHISSREPPSQPDQTQYADRQSFTSSSSEGLIRIMGPPLLPAYASGHVSKKSVSGEDEIWKEYDDLIDHVAAARHPKKVPQRLGLDRIGSGEWQSGMDYPANDKLSLTALATGLAIETSFADVPIILAPSEVMQGFDVEHEVRLRRSRIVSALHSSMEPVSPCSTGDCSEKSEDQPESGRDLLTDGSTSTSSGCDSPRRLGPTAALPAIPVTRHYESATHMNETSRARNPAKHSEMSYASLMISRWLSFGRVLFSPAHMEISRQPGKHVLVIDGLGNDDWSLYCAVTYQAEQAYIYDLKEIGHHRRPTISKPSDSIPPNFRRREIANFCEPFKFPDNFFSVIVLRFPPMMAEAKLKNIIAESRRVLAPGGYLELMLLDLDIVNMGVATRRALRDLKTKISVANPDVGLRPVIDNVQNVLGDKGFSKLSRCVVGVPVIGKPPSSADSPVSARSSGGSDPSAFSPSADPRPFGDASTYTDHGFSLNDLVSDHSDGADAKISKMVSRTARSWWQRCFETGVISDGNLSRSILSNKPVLSECRTRASSFKLLIAYAQKSARPTLEHKRRTMSEPFVTTLVPV